ncbi:hypothetical protein [Enterococcus faecium]|nr:hypothetical protein [Enterococcus faecium]MDN3079952.1 hypothetical protein [Enterococcus faecium]
MINSPAFIAIGTVKVDPVAIISLAPVTGAAVVLLLGIRVWAAFL